MWRLHHLKMPMGTCSEVWSRRGRNTSRTAPGRPRTCGFTRCNQRAPVTDEDRAAHEATAGAGCNAYLACVHACPAHAISLPMGEKNPAARFRNEHVSLADLIAANG